MDRDKLHALILKLAGEEDLESRTIFADSPFLHQVAPPPARC